MHYFLAYGHGSHFCNQSFQFSQMDQQGSYSFLLELGLPSATIFCPILHRKFTLLQGQQFSCMID